MWVVCTHFAQGRWLDGGRLHVGLSLVARITAIEMSHVAHILHMGMNNTAYMFHMGFSLVARITAHRNASCRTHVAHGNE